MSGERRLFGTDGVRGVANVEPIITTVAKPRGIDLYLCAP